MIIIKIKFGLYETINKRTLPKKRMTHQIILCNRSILHAKIEGFNPLPPLQLKRSVLISFRPLYFNPLTTKRDKYTKVDLRKSEMIKSIISNTNTPSHFHFCLPPLLSQSHTLCSGSVGRQFRWKKKTRVCKLAIFIYSPSF